MLPYSPIVGDDKREANSGLISRLSQRNLPTRKLVVAGGLSLLAVLACASVFSGKTVNPLPYLRNTDAFNFCGSNHDGMYNGQATLAQKGHAALFEGNAAVVQPPAPTTPKRPRVVLSISTFPGRIEVANATIASLMDQDFQADAFYIHVPSEVKRLGRNADLSEKEQAVFRHWGDRLTIRRPIDYGPSTKLIGALLLEHDPDTIVITFDDDVRYTSGSVGAIVDTMTRHPDYLVSGGCEISVDPGAEEIKWKAIEQEGECKGWPLGFLGAGYRVGWFTTSILDFTQTSPGCQLHDDVYLGGYVWRNAGKRVYKLGYKTLIEHGAWTDLSIYKVAGSRKNFQKPCLEYYNYLLDSDVSF